MPRSGTPTNMIDRSYTMTSGAQTAFVEGLDPEEQAFLALRGTICEICRKKDITSEDDPRLQRLVGKYSDKFPQLTPQSVVEELQRSYPASPIDTVDMVHVDSVAHSALTPCTEVLPGEDDDETVDYEEQIDVDVSGNVNSSYEIDAKNVSALSHYLPADDDNDETIRAGAKTAGEAEPEKAGCWQNFRESCRENGGYNMVTYILLLSAFMVTAFVASVVLTYLNYNQGQYRDWALAGGVTSTSVTFRVRGPSSDDGKAREFVVSSNPNLAIEKDQILNVPVAYADFDEEEHFFKRIEMEDLTPLTPYYYGITRPKRTPNSAAVAGGVGKFITLAPEGQRMEFTIATGSCALTGSKSSMFEKILDLDPLMFIHMGDFHYEDLNTLDVDERLGAYDKVMGSAAQRLLYMRTIFSYIWDDHDWLGNNQDSDDTKGAKVAKQAYTLGIPHYELGSSSSNEAEAAKYQAFTIGTVRFIITDLRSESVKSSEYYAGKVYSKEQQEWLFDELSRADNYDFVVWVTTRPWTNAEKVGSDSWGGFVSDRDELSAHIASTIGAGPQNLFVLSGDNHMVAFDDGSSTDYSNQGDYPGGFPLLHSGPLTNYGSGVVDFFKPSTSYFTEGCMAYNSELNYQFSTVDFTFPGDEEGCIRIRSYSKDTSNVIFEKVMCGEIMRYGTPEQDTCTLKKMSDPVQYIFIAAAGLIVLSGFLALWFLGWKGCYRALTYFGISVVYYLFTIAAAIAGAFCFGTLGVNMLALSSFILAQSFIGSLFVGKAVFEHCRSPDKVVFKSMDSGDVEANAKGGDDADIEITHDDLTDPDGARAEDTDASSPETPDKAEATVKPDQSSNTPPKMDEDATKLAVVQVNSSKETNGGDDSSDEAILAGGNKSSSQNDVIQKMSSSLRTPSPRKSPDPGVSETVAALNGEDSTKETSFSFADALTSPSEMVNSLRKSPSFRTLEERVASVITGEAFYFPDSDSPKKQQSPTRHEGEGVEVSQTEI